MFYKLLQGVDMSEIPVLLLPVFSFLKILFTRGEGITGVNGEKQKEIMLVQRHLLYPTSTCGTVLFLGLAAAVNSPWPWK